MHEIKKYRKEIDKIDLKLLNLLNKRTSLARSIGKEKKSENLFRPIRQADILKKLFSYKNNKIKPNVILSLWRSIFLSQINIQGGIKFILPKEIKRLFIKTIYDYFSHDIDIINIDNIKTAFKKIKEEKNLLLVLPYPGKNKNAQWWIKKDMVGVYIINTLPFIKEKKIHQS